MQEKILDKQFAEYPVSYLCTAMKHFVILVQQEMYVWCFYDARCFTCRDSTVCTCVHEATCMCVANLSEGCRGMCVQSTRVNTLLA